MKARWFHLAPYRFPPEHFQHDIESRDAVADLAVKFLVS